MAQEAVNGIIQALLGHQQIQNQRFKQQQDLQIAQKEAEQRDAQLQETIRQHKVESSRLDASLEMARQAHRLQQIEVQQKIGQGIQEGNLPAGTTEQPQEVQQIPGALGVQNPYKTYNVPGIDQPLTILSPEAHNQLVVSQRAALEQPAHENRMKEIATEAENQANLAKQNRAAMLEQSQGVITAENERAKQAQAGENYRTGITAASHVRAAQISAGLEGGDQVNVAAEPYIQQVQNGQLTDKDLSDKKLPKGLLNAVHAGLAQSGTVAPKKEEIQAVQKYQPIVPLVQAIDQYNQILHDSPVASRIPGNKAYADRKAIESQIDLLVPPLARTLATETGRLSSLQITKAEGIAEPSTNWLTSDPTANTTKRDALLKIANEGIDSALSRLPKGQAAHLKDLSGLGKIPYIGTGTASTDLQPGGTFQGKKILSVKKIQ